MNQLNVKFQTAIYFIFVTIYLKTKWAKINIHFENIRYYDSEFNKVENVKFNQDMFSDNEHYITHVTSKFDHILKVSQENIKNI